jgi:hypothetical protein
MGEAPEPVHMNRATSLLPSLRSPAVLAAGALIALGACVLVDPIGDGYELDDASGGNAGDDASGGDATGGDPIGGAGGMAAMGGMGGFASIGGMGGMIEGGGGAGAGMTTLSFGERPGADVTNVTSDNHLVKLDPTLNYGAAPSGWIDDSLGEERVTLLRFDLSAIPTTSQVQSAALSVFTHDNVQSSSPGVFALHELLESWDEGVQNGAAGTSNWNQRAVGVPWTAAGAGVGSRGITVLASIMPAQIATEYPVALPLALVQGWVTNPAINHGVVFVTAAQDGAALAMSEHATPTRRPLLTITTMP